MKIKPVLLALALSCSGICALAVYVLPPHVADSGEKRAFLPVQPEKIDYLLLQGSAASFPLFFTRINGSWMLTIDDTAFYPVDTERFTAFLSVLTDRRPFHDTGVRDPGVYSTGSGTSFSLTAGFGEKEMEQVYFGNPGTDAGNRYVSFGETVYRTDNSILPFLDLHTAFWIRKRPLETPLQKTSIQSATITNGNVSSSARENALPALYDALRACYCIDITNIPVEDKAITLTITTADSKTRTLRFTFLSDEYACMYEDIHNVSWIISVKTLEEIESLFR